MPDNNTQPAPLPTPAPLHPRARIRKAACALLAQTFPGEVYPSREEPWLQDELPVAGVYTTDEDPVESDLARRPDDRALTLVVDVLCKAGPRLDDHLDTLTLAVEAALVFTPLAEAVGDLVVLDMRCTGTSLGQADDGARLLGAATVTYLVEYRMPDLPEDSNVFRTGVTGWDLGDYAVGGGEGPDGRMEATDIYNMPQEEDNV